MKKTLLIVLWGLSSLCVRGAAQPDYVRVLVWEKDTTYSYILDEVEVVTDRVFKTKQEEREYRRYVAEYNRMVYNIKKAYPFALAMRKELIILNSNYEKLKTNKARKDYLKQVEADLRVRFENDLKKLTFRQGMILLKLIDRETNNNAYELIKEFRGGLTATFFQTFARLFKINLKTEYDAQGDDKMIEEIVLQIEQGLL